MEVRVNFYHAITVFVFSVSTLLKFAHYSTAPLNISLDILIGRTYLQFIGRTSSSAKGRRR